MQDRAARFVLILLITAMNAVDGTAQTSDKDLSAMYQELDSLFDDDELSSDLFAVVDSLIALESAKISTFSARVGYVSNIVSAGRTIGFEKYGLTPGVAYYHHSGAFGSINAYWNSEEQPHYYLTNLSFGYLHQKLRAWTFVLNHDFYFYHDTLETHAFNKSAQASVYYQYKKFNASLDYAFLYGKETSHRVAFTTYGRFLFKTSGWIETVTLMPSASALWGNANVVYIRQPRTAVSDLYQIIQSNSYPGLTPRNYLRLVNMLEGNRLQAARAFLLQRDYSPAQVEDLFDDYYSGQFQEVNTFGLLNYNLSLPVILRRKQFSLSLNYTYNIPVSLPGETIRYEPNSFFSTTLTYNLTTIRR